MSDALHPRGILRLVGAGAVALSLGLNAHARGDESRADFVFANGAEPRTLDPHRMTGMVEARIAEAIFEGLTRRDAKTLEVVPGQAESWEISPDGRRYTFHLRKDLLWSNGDPVAASDFVFSWLRLQAPETANEFAFLANRVRHAEAYNAYPAQVRALRGDPDAVDRAGAEGILRGLETLLDRHADGIPAEAWRAFTTERSVPDAVSGTREPALLSALSPSAGALSKGEAAGVLRALQAESDRRSKALSAALAHFGSDEGVFAPDERTLVFELTAMTPYFLELTSAFWALPVHRKSVSASPQFAFSAPGRIVTNGAFLLDEWSPKERIRLKRNPRYWGVEEVGLASIEVLPTEDRAEALRLYESGAVDWLPNGVPADEYGRLKSRPDFYASPGNILYYFRLNCAKAPFKDARVRRALSLSVDREAICRSVLRSASSPMTGFVPTGSPGYTSPPSRGYDPEAARALLSEAGFPAGKGFPQFTVLYNTDAGHAKIARFVADGWRRELGLDPAVEHMEWQHFLERQTRGEFDVIRGGWIGDYGDPATFMDLWATRGPNNPTGWSEPSYDRLIRLAADVPSIEDLSPAEIEAVLAETRERPEAERAIATLRAAKGTDRLAAAAALRMRLLREAEFVVLDRTPAIPVYQYANSGLLNPLVEGFYVRASVAGGGSIPNLEDVHPLRDIRLRRPAK